MKTNKNQNFIKTKGDVLASIPFFISKKRKFIF